MVLWQKHLNLSLLPLSDVEIELQHVFLFIICTYLPKHAEIAQLGELYTEDPRFQQWSAVFRQSRPGIINASNSKYAKLLPFD